VVGAVLLALLLPAMVAADVVPGDRITDQNIDKEAWGIPYSDIYDRSGELWKIWINDVAIRKQILPGAIEYPEERIFAPAIVMVDMQLEHATKASLPSLRFPGEQGWYFNQGEQAGITDDWFTVAALVNAGH